MSALILLYLALSDIANHEPNLTLEWYIAGISIVILSAFTISTFITLGFLLKYLKISETHKYARFIMNTMLASGGYPWTVIPFEKRDSYMKALEKASIELNIKDFTVFIAELVNERLRKQGPDNKA